MGSRGVATPERAQIDRALDEVAKTIGEHWHTAVENRARPLLALLRAEDASFYEDMARAMDFIMFISHQYFRTANRRNQMLALPRIIPHDPERTWPIESYIYATNVGASLFVQRSRYRIVFLENKSSVPLIAGDQPIINLNGHKDDDLCLYYPLSPKLGMMLTAEPDRFPIDRMPISRLQAETYNFAIYTRSDSQIYGDDGEYLQTVAALPKDLH